MHARLSVAGFVIVVGLCISIPTAAGAVGAAQTGSAQKHLSADQCKQGGWQSLTDGQGQPFRNQGQCISYAIHHPVSLSDLAGSLTGTASLVSVGPDGCSFLDMTFDATYPGSSAVGTVMLQMHGCVSLVFPPAPIPFGPGEFALTTNVGTLKGTAAGPITSVIVPPFSLFPASATLTLIATSGTGDFTEMTGTLNVSLQWPVPGSLSFIGTIAPT
jgi:hypothetical protein